MSNTDTGHFQKHFCQSNVDIIIIRNISVILGKWFTRCCLQIFLCLALVAFFFSYAELFVQFLWRALCGKFLDFFFICFSSSGDV